MRDKVASRRGKDGFMEYDFVAMDASEDFDRILAVLIAKQGVSQSELTDGFWWRSVALERSGIRFKLVFHEDVGNYLVCLDQNVWHETQLRSIAIQAMRDLK